MALMVGTAVSRKMDDLPMWLQYYPKILFDTINRSGTGVITKAATHSTQCVTNYMLEPLNISCCMGQCVWRGQNELKLFYTAFIDTGKLGDEALSALTEESYTAMTANGDVQLRYLVSVISTLPLWFSSILGKVGFLEDVNKNSNHCIVRTLGHARHIYCQST